MGSIVRIGSVAALLCLGVGCASSRGAATSSTPSSASTNAGVKAMGAAHVGDTTRCPITGEEFVVASDSPKVEHEGKTYYFCCAGCDKKFASDPNKYLQKTGT
jgi:Cu+-exporting ATPase